MEETMGSQLSQKRLDLCDAIAGLINGFELVTGVTVDSVTVKFMEEKADGGELSPMVKKRTVNINCSF